MGARTLVFGSPADEHRLWFSADPRVFYGVRFASQISFTCHPGFRAELAMNPPIFRPDLIAARAVNKILDLTPMVSVNVESVGRTSTPSLTALTTDGRIAPSDHFAGTIRHDVTS